MPFTYEFPRPAVTVDVASIGVTGDGARLLLIRRDREPFAGRWALPGGFLEMDEELEDAARRELAEETGLGVGRLAEIGAFGTVGRDPRGRTVSVAFLALTVGGLPAPEAGDDAAHAEWHRLARLPELAFDHARIVSRAKSKLAELARLGALAALLPAPFTLAQLHAVHAVALGDDSAARRAVAQIRRQGALRPTAARVGRGRLYEVRDRG